MAKIYTMGEILVEIMRVENDCPLNQAGVFKGPFPSGAPAIFISTAAQLGNKTKIWGGVGNDKFGTVLLERLRKDEVDTSDVTVSDTGSTAAAFVAYDSNGDREYIFHVDGTPASDILFTETNDIPDFFHVMGCSLMVNGCLKNQIDHACAYFASKGAKISFDPNIRPTLLGDKDIMDVAGVIMKNCSVFLPGLDELYMFADGRKDIDSAVNYLFENFSALEIIHIKLGKKGSRIITRTKTLDIPIYPIEKKYPIIDPTGAGDSFDAAFISALAEGKDLEQAGQLAAKAGALNSIALGPMAGEIKEKIYADLL